MVSDTISLSQKIACPFLIPLSHEVQSEVSCYQTTMELPIRFHGRHCREDSLNENVPGCRTFVQGGLCAVIDSGFQQVGVREPCEDDHGDFRMQNTRNQPEQDLEARHVIQIKLQHDAID